MGRVVLLGLSLGWRLGWVLGHHLAWVWGRGLLGWLICGLGWPGRPGVGPDSEEVVGVEGEGRGSRGEG